MTTYPVSALRTVALHAQGLGKAGGSQLTRDMLFKTINQIGCIQIDALHVVSRSQYLVLLSRLGNYAPYDFDAMASSADWSRELYQPKNR
jgi:uncharacterized protein YcaQ